jgi:LMBR1 domain-containing protein 1
MSAPRLSAPALAGNTSAALDANRERQRQLEARSVGREEGMSSKDRRELDALLREERTLVRRERLAAEARGEGQGWLMRTWHKTEAVFRPLKLIGGYLLLLVAFFIAVAMLLSGIDKAKNSVCKAKCGYIFAHVKIFNPINWILVKSSKVFPVDYVLVALLVLFFFCSSVVGIAGVGIRFLWLRLFGIRRGATEPQAMLLAIVMLTLISLAVNFALTTIVAPQYATFGPQTYCAKSPPRPGAQPDCSNNPELIRPCSERTSEATAYDVCTPSVVSTFINRVNIRYPYFGAFNFWAQFVFIGKLLEESFFFSTFAPLYLCRGPARVVTDGMIVALFLMVFVTSLIRAPKLGQTQLDQDAEEAEEEGLLASTGRRFGATWQDITGK